MQDKIYLDLETTGLNPFKDKILLCVINDRCSTMDSSVVDFLSNFKGTMVGYNLKFDLSFLPIDINFKVKDLYLGYSLLSAGYNHPKSLEAALQRLGIKLDKSVRKSFIGMQGTDFTEEQIKYALEDVAHLPKLEEYIDDKIKKFGLEEVYELENQALLAYLAMEKKGIYLNKEKWINAISGNSRELRKDIYDYYTKHDIKLFNMESPKQLQEAHTKLGISTIARKKTKEKTWEEKESTDIRALQNYDGQHKEYVGKLIELKGLVKLATSFLHFDDYTFENRIHPNFKQLGTHTGRVACTNPNMQQIPRSEKFRSCFEAEKGMIITADYSNCEMRILAEYAQDDNMLKAFDDGADIHSSMAMIMFPNVGTISKKENSHLRDQQKAINFGILYGAGPTSLQAHFEKYESAVEAMEKFNKAFPKVKQFQEETLVKVCENGYSETLLGRKRFFADLYKSHKGRGKDAIEVQRKLKVDKEYLSLLSMASREGCNHCIQGTNADITKLATVLIHNYIKDNKAKAWIINQVHDEIVIEVEDGIDIETVKRLMLEASSMVLKRCKMEVDVHIGKSWKK